MTMEKMLKMDVEVQVVRDFYVQVEKKREKFILLVQYFYVKQRRKWKSHFNTWVKSPPWRSRENSGIRKTMTPVLGRFLGHRFQVLLRSQRGLFFPCSDRPILIGYLMKMKKVPPDLGRFLERRFQFSSFLAVNCWKISYWEVYISSQ